MMKIAIELGSDPASQKIALQQSLVHWHIAQQVGDSIGAETGHQQGQHEGVIAGHLNDQHDAREGRSDDCGEVRSHANDGKHRRFRRGSGKEACGDESDHQPDLRTQYQQRRKDTACRTRAV